MNYNAIIDKYYADNASLRNILLVHSRAVTAKALTIVDTHPELNADRLFVEEAAMLHDIGIFLCDAHGISCFGSEPYLCHGHLGAELLRKEGYPKHARVCERHTGAGITKAQIIERNLPLPPQNFLPETIEEQIICYADKFFSKSHIEATKTIEQALKSLSKFCEEGVERFKVWVDKFE